MKTSNKLLLGLFVVILITLTTFIGIAKHNVGDSFNAAAGEMVTEKRPIESFSKIVVKGNIKVILVTNSQPALELKGDKNLLKSLQTSVKDGKLLLRLDQKTSSSIAIEARVNTTALEALDFSTGSSIECLDSIVAKKLSMSFATGARGKMKISTEQATLDCSTGSDVELTGSSGYIQMQASTGSVIDAMHLAAHKGNLEGSTGSEMNTAISDELEVSMSTGANAKNNGSPMTKKMELSTGGTFSKK